MTDEMLPAVRSLSWKCSRPLVVVVGSTGTGKTKLAVGIAEKFDGEVVSADSMQLYRGLPIGTNQATPEETRNVPHHLIGTLDPLTFGWNVALFRDEALPILEKLWDQGKLPVVAGGTMQYVEGILWDNLLDVDPGEGSDDYGASALPEDIRHLPTEDLYGFLKKLDPHQAEFTSPGNRRRITRALQIYFVTGKSWENQIAEQHSELGENAYYGGTLRFPNTRILWLHSDKEVLEGRLRRRIDAMVESGLEREITEFYDSHSETYFRKLKELSDLGVTEEDSLDKGIFQSIALKEFREFLELSPEDRNSERGRSIFATGASNLHIATRKYAKRQNRWVKRRLLLGTVVPPVFKFDSSDPSQWETLVESPASEVVRSLLLNEPCSISPETVSQREYGSMDIRRVYRCDLCNRDVAGIQQWNEHLRGKGHKHFASKARRDHLMKLSGTLDQLAAQKKTLPAAETDDIS